MSARVDRCRRDRGELGERRDVLAIGIASFLAVATSLLLRVLHSPDEFADFPSYQSLVEELREQDFGLTFEPFSHLVLYLCSTLTNDSADAVSIATYVNALVYTCAILPIAIRYASGWENVLLLGALYSPLLAFVTLRATPAYLLIATAFLIRRSHPGKALIAALTAVGFHVSAALALIPLLLTTDNGLARVFSGPRTRWMDVWIVSAAVAIYILSGGFSEYVPGIFAFLGEQGAFAKFAAYAAAVNETPSRMHHVYFVMTLSAVVLLLISRRDFNDRDVRYITLSFLIYAALTISPVVAFRASIFWMLPLVLILPLHRYMQTAPVSFVFCVTCGVLYSIDFYGVLS